MEEEAPIEDLRARLEELEKDLGEKKKEADLH